MFISIFFLQLVWELFYCLNPFHLFFIFQSGTFCTQRNPSETKQSLAVSTLLQQLHPFLHKLFLQMCQIHKSRMVTCINVKDRLHKTKHLKPVNSSGVSVLTIPMRSCVINNECQEQEIPWTKFLTIQLIFLV